MKEIAPSTSTSKYVRVSYIVSYIVPNKADFISEAEDAIIEDVQQAYKDNEVYYGISVEPAEDATEEDVHQFFYDILEVEREEP